jgi:hypothetical protein
VTVEGGRLIKAATTTVEVVESPSPVPEPLSRLLLPTVLAAFLTTRLLLVPLRTPFTENEPEDSDEGRVAVAVVVLKDPQGVMIVVTAKSPFRMVVVGLAWLQDEAVRSLNWSVMKQ